MKLTAVFRKVPEGYVAFVEELPGANTHSETLDEAREHRRSRRHGPGGEPRVFCAVAEGAEVIREAPMFPAA